MEKNHLLKIISSLIVKFSDVRAENFYFQVKLIDCYLREIISFTKQLTLETWASLKNTLSNMKIGGNEHHEHIYDIVCIRIHFKLS